MDLLEQIPGFDGISAGGASLLAGWGNAHLATFLLVAARLAGLVFVATGAAQHTVGWHVKVFFVLTLAGVLTPLIGALGEAPAAESSAPMIELVDGEEPVARASTTASPFSIEFVPPLLSEAAFGAALGFGILVVLASLQMAGELIDPQCGLQGDRLFQMDSIAEGSLSGRLLMIVGLMAFLVLPAEGMGSQGGLMLVVQSFLGTFESIPVSTPAFGAGLVEMLIALVHHSIALCLLVAAPVLACGTLLSLVIGLAGRAIPEINHQSYATPVRTVCCLTILAFSLSGAAGLLTREIPATLKQIHALL